MIYAAHLCADGLWLLLGRDYRPYGQGLSGWVNYDDCLGTRLRLTDDQLRRMDGGRDPYRPGDKCVYLFHDGTRPDRSAAAADAYLRRVAVLTRMIAVAS